MSLNVFLKQKWLGKVGEGDDKAGLGRGKGGVAREGVKLAPVLAATTPTLHVRLRNPTWGSPVSI